MSNKDEIIVTIFSIVTAVLLIWLLICCCISEAKLEELDKKVDNLNQLIQDSSLVEVNGEIVDEDDYCQEDWRTYTPAKDSVE